MTYTALILLAACIVLGFCLYVTLAGTAEQIRDLLEEREELLTEIRRLRMGNHPAGRALRINPEAAMEVWHEGNVTALRAALAERDAEHEGAERQRLDLAKSALVKTGYFTEAEVGDDVAPRIYELVEAMRTGKFNPATRDTT